MNHKSEISDWLPLLAQEKSGLIANPLPEGAAVKPLLFGLALPVEHVAAAYWTSRRDVSQGRRFYILTIARLTATISYGL